MPGARISGTRAKAAEAALAANRILSISASDLMRRKARMIGVASRNSVPGSTARRRSKSANGIRRWVSGPIGIPTGPVPAISPRVAASRPTPSSSGSGEDHVRISSIQVRPMHSAPMPGITATGLPRAGTIRNQGRVGLCQNWVRKPLNQRISGSVLSRSAARPWAAIARCARSSRASNSLAGNPRGGGAATLSRPSADRRRWPGRSRPRCRSAAPANPRRAASTRAGSGRRQPR